MPGAEVRSFQDLELAEPELRLIPDDRRISESGWTRANVATVVRALGDGIWVGEHFDGERRLDMILRAKRLGQPGRARGRAGRDADGRRRAARRAGAASSRPSARRGFGAWTAGARSASMSSRRPACRCSRRCEKLETDVGPAIQPLLPPDGGIRYAGDAGSLETALADMRVNICAGAAGAVPDDGGAVPLGARQRVRAADRAAREPRRRARHPILESVHAADARHADDGRFHHPDRRGRQQRDPAGREHAHGRARRHGPQERRAPCARGAHAADLRDFARTARRASCR